MPPPVSRRNALLGTGCLVGAGAAASLAGCAAGLNPRGADRPRRASIYSSASIT